MPVSLITNRVLDIPFAMTGLIYAASTIFVNIPENKQKTARIIFGIISVLILVTLLYINLLVPDKPTISI
jgi:hypothetical protein